MFDKKKHMSSKKQIYKAVIIGAGRIASGFDTPRSRDVLTHAHAVLNNPRVELVGMTDIDAKKGRKEALKWKTVFFNNEEEMITRTSPDIVIIATPDSTHAEILLRVLQKHPRLIICEKPVVSQKNEIEMIHTAAAKDPIPVIVNFRRRFDPTVITIRNALFAGEYGEVISANAVYTKGILHNGGHIMNLLFVIFLGNS